MATTIYMWAAVVVLMGVSLGYIWRSLVLKKELVSKGHMLDGQTKRSQDLLEEVGSLRGSLRESQRAARATGERLDEAMEALHEAVSRHAHLESEALELARLLSDDRRLRSRINGIWSEAGSGHSMVVSFQGLEPDHAMRRVIAERASRMAHDRVMSGSFNHQRTLECLRLSPERQGGPSHFLRVDVPVEVEVNGTGYLRRLVLSRDHLARRLTRLSRPEQLGAGLQTGLTFASESYPASRRLAGFVHELASLASRRLTLEGAPVRSASVGEMSAYQVLALADPRKEASDV